MADPDDWTDYDPRPYIAANQWVTAKTVPQHPHQYLLAERSIDRDEHTRMITWLNQTGEPRTFAGVRYKYVEVDGWLYWVSRPPPWGGKGLIINRRRVEDVTEPAACPTCGFPYATADECSNCGWKSGTEPVQLRLEV